MDYIIHVSGECIIPVSYRNIKETGIIFPKWFWRNISYNSQRRMYWKAENIFSNTCFLKKQPWLPAVLSVVDSMSTGNRHLFIPCPSSAICHLSSTILHLLSAVHHLLSVIHHLSSVINCLSSAVHCLSCNGGIHYLADGVRDWLLDNCCTGKRRWPVPIAINGCIINALLGAQILRHGLGFLIKSFTGYYVMSQPHCLPTTTSQCLACLIPNSPLLSNAHHYGKDMLNNCPFQDENRAFRIMGFKSRLDDGVRQCI